jgi:alkanesulfonate monooxygenase SsuD/methylene tetrahydromethanopterin reductase-like flavin-dependent oxidoreductase (luciferase family)
MTRLGVVFRPQLPPEDLERVVRAADASTIDDLWLWEDCFAEGGISTAAAALAWSQRLHIGVGLLPVPLRNVALTAMEISSLARMFPGRVEIGIGHGVQDWMAQVSAKVGSPLTLLREYAAALTALLAGETVTIAGRYVSLDGVKLAWPPTTPPRIWAGGEGPKTLALCGEIAGGTLVTSGNPPARVREIADLVRATGGAEHEIAVNLLTVTSSEARYLEEIREWGFDPAEDVGVFGDAATVAAAARRLFEAGATRVALQPPPDEPDLVEFVRFAADEVRPLL